MAVFEFRCIHVGSFCWDLCWVFLSPVIETLDVGVEKSNWAGGGTSESRSSVLVVFIVSIRPKVDL